MLLAHTSRFWCNWSTVQPGDSCTCQRLPGGSNLCLNSEQLSWEAGTARWRRATPGLSAKMPLSTVLSTGLHVRFLTGPIRQPCETGVPTHFTGEEPEALETKRLFWAHTISNWQRKKFEPGLTRKPTLVPPYQPLSLLIISPAPQLTHLNLGSRLQLTKKRWDGNERVKITRQAEAQGRVGKENNSHEGPAFPGRLWKN